MTNEKAIEYLTHAKKFWEKEIGDVGALVEAHEMAIEALSEQEEKSTTEEKIQLAEENSTRKLIYLDEAICAIKMLLEQSEDDEHDKIWNDAIRGSINAIKHHVPSAQQSNEYQQGWFEGRKALREEIWEDGRDRLD